MNSCPLCNKATPNLIDHPIDEAIGDTIGVCFNCKKKIYNGLTEKDSSISKDLKERILRIRKSFLRKKYKSHPVEYVEDMIKYERVKSDRGGIKVINKNKCYVCGNADNVILLIPRYIRKFEFSENKLKKYAVPICKSCKSNML